MKTNFYHLEIKWPLFLFIFILPIYSLSQQLNKSELKNDSALQIMTSDTISNVVKKEFIKRTYKPDTVFLMNGDKITGKILSFEQGRLSIDGQGPGVVSIKWYKIITIAGGSRVFKVEDIYGVRYIGTIVHSADSSEIDVQGKLKYGIRLENLLRMYPLESEWYKGIKGDLGAGVNYTKSSTVLNLNANYNLYYIKERWRFLHNFSYISNSTDKDPSSIRLSIDFQALYALPNRWLLSEYNSWSRNDELGLKSRFSFQAGGGNNIIQTETQRLIIITGIARSAEVSIESSDVLSTFEWPFSVQHTLYSFVKPNLSATTSIVSYVGITEKGRYRVDASTDITWEFISNYKFKLTFYYDYDNKIVEGKSSSFDYGTVLSLAIQLK
jgi:hypothetical protein